MEDAEAVAGAVLRDVRLDGAERPCPRLVARRWKIGVYFAPRSVRWSEIAERTRVRGEDRIYIRTGLSPQFQAHVLGHEIGHVAVARLGLRLDDEEAFCNHFGGALIAPEPAVWRTWRSCERVDQMVAEWPEVTPTCIALRVGEVRCADVWIVERGAVLYARGRARSARPIVKAARGARHPELSACRLSDGSSRVAVVAMAG